MLRSRERKAQQRIVTRLENEIAELELRQTELTADLEKSETYEKSGAAPTHGIWSASRLGSSEIDSIRL